MDTTWKQFIFNLEATSNKNYKDSDITYFNLKYPNQKQICKAIDRTIPLEEDRTSKQPIQLSQA